MNTSKNKKSYKLISRLISLSEPIDKLDNIWDQWDLCDTVTTNIEYDVENDLNDKITNWNTHSFHDKDKHKYFICLCSHTPIKVLNLMENNLTKQRCTIGSCCINKFATTELRTEMKIKIGEKSGKRYCKLCKRKLPDEIESWKIYHKKCYYEVKKNDDIKGSKD